MRNGSSGAPTTFGSDAQIDADPRLTIFSSLETNRELLVIAESPPCPHVARRCYGLIVALTNIDCDMLVAIRVTAFCLRVFLQDLARALSRSPRNERTVH